MTDKEKKPLVMTETEAVSIYQKLRVSQVLFILSYSALLVLFSVLNITQTDGSLKLWLVQCVPLLIFIPGLVQQRFRTYSWICFVILPYFTWSVVNAMSPLIRWHDVLVVALSVIIFMTAMMASRWLQYWQYYQNQTRV